MPDRKLHLDITNDSVSVRLNGDTGDLSDGVVYVHCSSAIQGCMRTRRLKGDPVHIRTSFHSLAVLLLSFYSLILSTRAGGQRLYQPQSMDVRGVVTDTLTHRTIAGALVTLDRSPLALGRPASSSPSPDTTRQQLTDEDGRFEFTHVALGRHFFFVSKSGYIAANNQDNDYYEVQIGPLPANTPLEMRFFLTPSAELTGQVTQKGAGPISGVPLTLYQRVYRDGREDWKSTRTTSTDSDGRYAFSDLEAGAYIVVSSWVLDNDPGPPQRLNPCSLENFVPLSGYPATANPGVRDFSPPNRSPLPRALMRSSAS
jgi:hypothetical protein